ncbi:DUF1624 domain-containing protein [Pseudobacter ginsenosidimutans]|uniref:Putative membrane protein n=1 Tax=Pseudobacter ginsenosidimutans TaxID=661488 RepID=A0A4Q7MSW5_9BACT|nr:heparan-alpha-glucosaminide N-acetyltransferase domain-containing protein [Pseudobacter ginsenosidimutans]QEC41301.1 DUF1624 domain-containing protein [Pseudobacter ginsenosidimutans]RZS71926.1 putative membrane protein [Pseudobacter ginsenosidimutans]
MQPLATSRSRITSIDLLRGVIIVIMAIDHVRDFFTNARFDPTDLTQTTPGLFFTRWITHFCAPVFMFLAGTGAFLFGQKRSKAELSKFLLTRGLFLVLIEFTVSHFALHFNFRYDLILAMVIWALGMCMIFLSLLVKLPLKAILIISLLLILGHNALDGISPAALGGAGWLWNILHVPGFFPLGANRGLVIGYPLIPWIGVMGAGYAFGKYFQQNAEQRRKIFIRLGLLLTALFIIIRFINIYGDPQRWSPQSSSLYTFLSFLNTTKYPPSLSFLLMTLGPAIFALGLMERAKGPFTDFFTVYGKVPMFFFLTHFYLIHLLALITGVIQGYDASAFLNFVNNFPKDFGFGLGGVYAYWATVVLLLYFPCKWYGRLKAASRNPLLSYI